MAGALGVIAIDVVLSGVGREHVGADAALEARRARRTAGAEIRRREALAAQARRALERGSTALVLGIFPFKSVAQAGGIESEKGVTQSQPSVAWVIAATHASSAAGSIVTA